jgi:hypothetical protein
MCAYLARGSGWGLAPARGFGVNTYDDGLYDRADIVPFGIFMTNRFNHAPTLVALPFDLGLSPFMRGHMTHMPNGLAVRGLGSLTVLQLRGFSVMCPVLGFSTEMSAEARLDTQRCNLAIQRQQV